jgi:hypothetical protein
VDPELGGELHGGRSLQRRQLRRGLLHHRRLLLTRRDESCQRVPGMHPGERHDRVDQRRGRILLHRRRELLLRSLRQRANERAQLRRVRQQLQRSGSRRDHGDVFGGKLRPSRVSAQLLPEQRRPHARMLHRGRNCGYHLLEWWREFAPRLSDVRLEWYVFPSVYGRCLFSLRGLHIAQLAK